MVDRSKPDFFVFLLSTARLGFYVPKKNDVGSEERDLILDKLGLRRVLDIYLIGPI